MRYRDQGVVGLGLANDEGLFPPEPFAEAFAIAKDAGLLSVPHAGELAGPESVLGALDPLGADRDPARCARRRGPGPGQTAGRRRRVP